MVMKVMQNGKRLIVPMGAVWHSARLTEQMINACIGHVAKSRGQISKAVTKGNGAHPIRRTSSRLCDLKGSGEQGVEAGREEELEVLNAREPIQGYAWVYPGASQKIEDVEMDQAQTFALFFVRCAGASLLIDDLLQGLWQVSRRKLEVAFCGDLLSEPRVQHVVVATKGDGAGTDDRYHFLHFHASEKLIPKILIVRSLNHNGGRGGGANERCRLLQ